MIQSTTQLNENNHRINTFKRELMDFIKKYRESDHELDKQHWMRMIQIAWDEIKKEKKKSTSQRAHEFDKAQFMKHHYTGYIPSNAYERSEAPGGLSWMGDKSKWPVLLDKGQYGPFDVEFRQRNEKNEYVSRDEDGNIKRDIKGNPIMMTDDEKRAANLSLKDTTIAAFVDGNPIGLASNEFGAVGVWVEKPYQKQGIGVALLEKHIEQRPDVQSGRAKIGQMTNAGYNMTGKYYEKLTKKYGPGWFEKWKKEKQLTESDESSIEQMRSKTEQFRQSLLSKYPQIQELHFGIQAYDVLYIYSLKIKLEDRHQGIGSDIIRNIKKFADENKLTIVLSPEAERGYKDKLDRFYKGHGFVDNRGRKKDYRYASFFGRTMYRKPRLNEGAILLHKDDKKEIYKYLDEMENYSKRIFKHTDEYGYEKNRLIDSEKLVNLLQTKSDELSANFNFKIQYYFKSKSSTKGHYDESKNTIGINVFLHSNFAIWRNGMYRIFKISGIDFKSIKLTFFHEFVHHIQTTLRKEKTKQSYTVPADWSDKDKYMKRPWEQQAHAIAYLEKLKQDLNTKNPKSILLKLKKTGLLKQSDLNNLKTSDYKSWKAIMKQAIMAIAADIKEKK